MSKAPCCWASNDLSRDKKDYIRCSTRQVQPPCDDGKAKKGKKGKDKDNGVCCSTAFRMQMAKEAANEDTDELQCGPSKKGKKNKSNKDYYRCFTANMICMKLYMPGRDFECPEKLRMNVNICRGCKPILCSNRINVNCLPQEPSARFSMLAECLEKELNEGISVSVVYMKKEIGEIGGMLEIIS